MIRFKNQKSLTVPKWYHRALLLLGFLMVFISAHSTYYLWYGFNDNFTQTGDNKWNYVAQSSASGSTYTFVIDNSGKTQNVYLMLSTSQSQTGFYESGNYVYYNKTSTTFSDWVSSCFSTGSIQTRNYSGHNYNYIRIDANNALEITVNYDTETGKCSVENSTTQYDLTFNTVGCSVVGSTPTKIYAGGSTLEIIVAPNSGYVYSGVVADNCDAVAEASGDNKKIKLSNATDNTTVTVTYVNTSGTTTPSVYMGQKIDDANCSAATTNVYIAKTGCETIDEVRMYYGSSSISTTYDAGNSNYVATTSGSFTINNTIELQIPMNKLAEIGVGTIYARAAAHNSQGWAMAADELTFTYSGAPFTLSSAGTIDATHTYPWEYMTITADFGASDPVALSWVLTDVSSAVIPESSIATTEYSYIYEPTAVPNQYHFKTDYSAGNSFTMTITPEAGCAAAVTFTIVEGPTEECPPAE